MAPSRAKQNLASVGGPSHSKGRPREKSRNHPYTDKPWVANEDALPGVQKLKSALRQTKRLLAKDKLAADVRVATERRSKVLEADLARAEQFRKERQYAAKYHKVKFFERQKVVRKIKQTKRSIANSEGKDEIEKLKSTLMDLRVDLNYIVHFPKTMKYISLFPPEVRRIHPTPAPEVSDDNEERSKVRKMIRQQMEHGELNTEPENELGRLGQETTQISIRMVDAVPSSKATTSVDNAESDEFFGDDGEEDSQRSEAESDP